MSHLYLLLHNNIFFNINYFYVNKIIPLPLLLIHDIWSLMLFLNMCPLCSFRVHAVDSTPENPRYEALCLFIPPQRQTVTPIWVKLGLTVKVWITSNKNSVIIYSPCSQLNPILVLLCHYTPSLQHTGNLQNMFLICKIMYIFFWESSQKQKNFTKRT